MGAPIPMWTGAFCLEGEPKQAPELDEWTYIVTVKHLKAGERVQVYSATEPFKRWPSR